MEAKPLLLFHQPLPQAHHGSVLEVYAHAKHSKRAAELEVDTEYILPFYIITHATVDFNQYCLIIHGKINIILLVKKIISYLIFLQN